MKWRSRRLLPVVALLVVPAACDLPLEGLPVFEERWLVPVNGDSISLEALLPPLVAQPTGDDAITIVGAVEPVSASLGELCGSPCTTASGTTAPKPAFTAEVAANFALPVVRLELGSGSRVRIRIGNDLGFDPILPAGGGAGQIVLAVASAEGILAVDTIREALPSGGMVERTLALPENVVVSAPLELRAHIVSPAGSAVPIDATRTLTLTGLAPATDVPLIPLIARRVAVVIESRQIESEGVPLRFEVDDDLIRRIKGAGVELTIENPLPVSGSLAARFLVGDEEIIPPKPVPIEPGSFVFRLTLTQDEIRDVLSTPFGMLQLTGELTSTGEEVELTPTSAIRIRARFGLRVEVGG